MNINHLKYGRCYHSKSVDGSKSEIREWKSDYPFNALATFRFLFVLVFDPFLPNILITFHQLLFYVETNETICIVY